MWFRRDLRVDDHPALAAAAARGEVVALWVADPALLTAPHHRAPVRLRFLRACLEALDAQLREIGIALVVREGDPAQVVPAVASEAGADRVLAMDLHSGQCVGYFDIPVDHVYGDSVILDYLASKRISTGDLVVVSPDVGGVARARAFAKKLNDAPLAIVDKRRSAHNVSEVMNLIGDVRGKVAVLVDDMIDTAGTITNAAKVLRAEGAREVYACATHAVFSPPAIERLSSGVFEEVVVTNTIPVREDQQFSQLTVLSVANLLGEAIWRVYSQSSVQSIRE
jgi:ribose-phosphate pyrophosphokinase